MTNRHFRAILAVFLIPFLAALPACDRTSVPQRAAADTASASPESHASPVETARRVNALRWQRDYSAMSELLTDSGRTSTIRFLQSVDRLMDAHDAMQHAAAERYGPDIHHAWNISAMENNLGIFSRDIAVISQSMRADEAIVTIQEADRVPLVRSRFIRIDGRWKLVSPINDTSICEPLETFASRIDAVAERIRDGLSPVGYYDAVTKELIPGIAQVALAESNSPTRVTDATTDDEP